MRWLRKWRNKYFWSLKKVYIYTGELEIMEEELRLIRETILDTAKKFGIEIDRIILFGSRARGDYRENSDWDILIVTEEKPNKEIEEKFWLEIGRKLIKARIIPEVIVSSREELEKYSKYYGFVHYHALKEGILVK